MQICRLEYSIVGIIGIVDCKFHKTAIKYNLQILQNLLNLEFPNPAKPAKPTKPRIPIPFKPLFNSQWYMFLNQLFDS